MSPTAGSPPPGSPTPGSPPPRRAATGLAPAAETQPAAAPAGPRWWQLSKSALGLVVSLPALLLIGMVRVYQWTLSPLVGRQCRYLPTCSNYFIGAVRKYGAVRGSVRGIARICRCHPFHPGGYDPP